jgi:hypothetical protein
MNDQTNAATPSLATRTGIVPLMSCRDFAARLGVSMRSFRRYMAAGRLLAPVGRVGKQPRWRCEDVEEWIAAGMPARSGAAPTPASGNERTAAA